MLRNLNGDDYGCSLTFFFYPVATVFVCNSGNFAIMKAVL